jgi:hypothetical protein
MIYNLINIKRTPYSEVAKIYVALTRRFFRMWASDLWHRVVTNELVASIVKKVKLSLQQAVKADRFVRRRGSHILSRHATHRRR